MTGWQCITYCNIRTAVTLHYATLHYITLHCFIIYVYTVYLLCLICFLVPTTPASWAAFILLQGKLWTCPALVHHMLLHSPVLKLRSSVCTHDLSWFTCKHLVCLQATTCALVFVIESRRHNIRKKVTYRYSRYGMALCLHWHQAWMDSQTTILPKCGGIKETEHAVTWIGRSQNKKLLEWEG